MVGLEVGDDADLLEHEIETGARVAVDAAKTGAGYIKTEAEKSDVGKKAVKVVEDVASTAGDAALTAVVAAGIVCSLLVIANVSALAVDAGKKTGGIVVDTADKAADIVSNAAGDVGTNAKRVAKVVGFGASFSTTLDSGLRSAKKASLKGCVNSASGTPAATD